jgi:predicted nucleic acid-binding protein
MLLVVDASVLVEALLIDGAARARLAEANLQAPELIDAEQHALRALATSHQLGLRRHASRHLWPRAWELRANLSAYDALYVALAEQLGATLLTADARAARAPGLNCPVEVMGFSGITTSNKTAMASAPGIHKRRTSGKHATGSGPCC